MSTVDLTVVSTFFPLPPDRGDPIRVLMILRALASARPFDLRVVRRTDTTNEQEAELRGLLPNVTITAYDSTPYTLDRFGPLGRYPESTAAGMPPWVRTRYSRDLHIDLQSRTGYGFAIGEAAGAYFRDTQLRWHWDKANVLAGSTVQDIEEATSVAHKLRARYIAEVSTRFESTAIKLAATVSVTSDAESDRLLAHHRRTADFILPSCVPLPRYHRAPAARELVWLSSFNFRPNLFGLRAFLEQGWPRLEQSGFTLTLVGSGLNDGLRVELAAYPGVKVAGYVEDLEPVLARAQAGVVPIWSGAGVKLKTLTLLSHAVPVFSTPVGAEGVPASPGLQIAGTPTDLADAILRTPAAELAEMSALARSLVEAEFSESSFAARLLSALARTGRLPAVSPTAEGL